MGVERLKVVHIIPTGGWAGSERIAFSLAREQASDGIDVSIAVKCNKSYTSAFYKEQAGSNVKIIDIPGRYEGAQAIADFINKVNAVESDRAFDVVHGHLGLGCRAAGCFKSNAYRLGHMHVRFLTSQHGNLDGVVAVSEWQLRDVPSWFSGDVVLVPNFLDHVPNISSQKRKAFMRKHYLKDEGFIFGVICRMHIEKGVDLVIDAFNDLQLPFAKLVILGEGPYEEFFKQLAGNNPNIIFAGFVKNAAEYMRIFDCTISPSRADSFGMSVLESLSCGVPVVSSSTFGAMDIMKGDPLIFKIDDLFDLKLKMRAAYDGVVNNSDFSRYNSKVSYPLLRNFLEKVSKNNLDSTS